MDSIERILSSYRRIAVVGLSDDPGRPSHGVSLYMQEQGYLIFPVNPLIREWRGFTAYPDLESVPQPLEIVDIFRRSEAVGAIVDTAIALGAKAIWMQEGVVDEAAAARAREAGLDVVMDRCLLKDHRRAASRGPVR